MPFYRVMSNSSQSITVKVIIKFEGDEEALVELATGATEGEAVQRALMGYDVEVSSDEEALIDEADEQGVAALTWFVV